MTALVSVLLPAFNAAATIALCLRSLVRQTERRWECIVVDDGSDDETYSRAMDFARADPRFQVVPVAPGGAHLGLIAALNHGLEHCTGRYVARMDADDVMVPERLQAQREALDRQEELAAVGCHVRLFPRRQLSDGLRRYEQWLNSIHSAAGVRRDAFVECPVAHPSLMVRRPILTELRYRSCGWPEDYDLVLRLLERGPVLGMVPQRLLGWRDGPGRLWRTDPSYGIDRFTACKAHFLARGLLGLTDRYVLWGYGATGRSLRRALLDHGKEPSHIVELHPGRLGQRIHGASVIPPEQLTTLATVPIVVSVAGEAARGQIRAALSGLGRTELVDYVCCA